MEEKAAFCKSCFEEIHLSYLRNIVEPNAFLCDKCISLLKTKLVLKKINGIIILYLSEYDGIEKQWLMHYKEYGDIELAPCFLLPYLFLVRLYGTKSIFVPVPSKRSRIEKRGFDHLSQMLKASHLPYVSALEMKEEEEQKNRKALMRSKMKQIRLNCNKDLLNGKHVILFDDVFTSGTTFFSSVNALKNSGVKSIRGLILMDNSSKHQQGL